MNNILYAKLQALFVAETGLKVGDIVNVTVELAQESGILGSQLNYDSDWDSVYGHEVEVTEITDDYIVIMDEDRYSYTVPFFVLSPPLESYEFLKSIEHEELIAGYETLVYANHVEVGCQTITYEQLDKLLITIEKIRVRDTLPEIKL